MPEQNDPPWQTMVGSLLVVLALFNIVQGKSAEAIVAAVDFGAASVGVAFLWWGRRIQQRRQP